MPKPKTVPQAFAGIIKEAGFNNLATDFIRLPNKRKEIISMVDYALRHDKDVKLKYFRQAKAIYNKNKYR